MRVEKVSIDICEAIEKIYVHVLMGGAIMPPMKTEQAVKFFETQVKLAAALGIDQSTISGSWREYPPPLRQLQIEALTGGELRAEPECDKYRVPATKAV